MRPTGAGGRSGGLSGFRRSTRVKVIAATLPELTWAEPEPLEQEQVRGRRFSVRAYDDEAMMVDAEVIDGADSAERAGA